MYYVAIDTLLIATEFEDNDKIYQFLSKIYSILGNKDLSEKISNPNLRIQAVNSLKKELTGISQKSWFNLKILVNIISLTRACSSAGQSSTLIMYWSQVRILAGPPQKYN